VVSAWAATNDVTGLTPTLHVTYDASSVVNDNGTGSLSVNNEGTPTYTDSPNGKALNTAIFTPYGNLSSVCFAGTDFTLSAYATLGTNPNGLLFHMRDDVGGSTGGLVLRRGSTNQVVLTLNAVSTPILTAAVPCGDAAYHHYAVAATSGGLTLYVDGVALASASSNATAVAKYAYQFGSRHGGARAGEAKFGGKIDDFRVYASALSPGQIAALGTTLTRAAGDAGSISIKTGPRGNAIAEGNIWMFTASTLGAVPVAANLWNKTFNHTTGSSLATITGLVNSAGVVTGTKLYYAIPNTYLHNAGVTTANGSLTKTYFDDGTASAYTVNEAGTSVVLPNPGVTRGWQALLTGVPYQHADLYVLIASDQAQASFKTCPILVKVGDGPWTYYYGLPGLEKTLAGNQTWAGSVYATDTLKEGNHYLKVPLSDLTPDTPVSIAHGPRNTGIQQRIGLAGLQLVKRDSAAPAGDPYYLRTVTGAADWTAAAWDHAGTSGNTWLDSTPEWKTTAILTASGGTTLTLPEAGATAEAVSVRGSGSFTLGGVGGLALNGGAVLDAYSMQAADIVTIEACVSASNVTVSANNAGAAGVGYTRLTNPTNAFSALTIPKGTLAADSLLPGASTLVLGGGAVMFTASGTVTNPLQVTGDSILRVWPGVSGEVSGPLAGTANITKSDTGTLTLSGGGSFGNLLWNNTGTIRLAGTAPLAFANTSGNGSATTLEIASPAVTLSGILSLGAVTFPLGEGVAVTANSLRGCDGGTYNTTVNQTGGRLTILGNNTSASSSASVLLGHWQSTGNYTLSGGDFLATNANAMLSWHGLVTWTISGTGRAYVMGVNVKGSQNTADYGTLNLNGGTLEVGANGIFASNTARPRTVNLGAGTLRAWNNFTFASSAVSTAASLTDGDAGLLVDPSGYTITWNAPLAGAGKLVLRDSSASPGTLRLLGASTHSGGVELSGGTLEVGHATGLGTGPLDWSGGSLTLAAIHASCGVLTVTNTVTLNVRVGIEADLSGSGSLTASSVTLNNDAADTVAVVLDLNGIDTPLAEYPVLLSDSLPVGATDKMTVTFINGGAGLLETAAVALDQRADGVYAVFTGIIPPKNLFWRNGVAAGNWSLFVSDTPWGVGSVSGEAAFYTEIDTLNFTDTDQSSATVTVLGPLLPVAFNLNNVATAYTFNEDVGGGSIEMPSTGFTKSGSGSATFNVPVALSNATLTVDAGTLQVNAALGAVQTATLSSPVTVAEDATLAFGGSGTQTIAGSLTGAGTLCSLDGRLRIAASGAAFGGDVVAAGGVLEITNASAFLSSAAGLIVEAGAVMEFTALDASGYNVTNSKPIEIAGTLKVLERDSTARGVKLYDGASILLKGTNMNSGHAMDLFDRPTFALVSGSASISPLDPDHAAQASITVRTEHSPKTFDVRDADAVLVIDVPLIGGAPGIVLDKVGPGLLRFTGVSTTTSKLLVSAGALEIGGAGTLGAGASAQPMEILAGATFRYASSASQTLSGAITCAGTLEKTGTGRLVLSGALTLDAGGVLAVPAELDAADAVEANSLTLNGGVIRVANADDLTAGKTYTLLTSAAVLPAGITEQVTGLGPRWKAEIVDEGKTLLVYKRLGTLIQLQ
jgi:autotransporter-associated beta strand protein